MGGSQKRTELMARVQAAYAQSGNIQQNFEKINLESEAVNKNTKMTKEEAEIAKGGDEGQGDRLRNAKIKNK